MQVKYAAIPHLRQLCLPVIPNVLRCCRARSFASSPVHTLRLCYLILAAGLGLYVWPTVLHHTPELAVARRIQFSLLAGLGLPAVLGLRYPVQMIPLLLFELIYLLAFALPLWRAHQVTASAAEDIQACLMVVIFLPLIPWGYVARHYILRPGDRWTRAYGLPGYAGWVRGLLQRNEGFDFRSPARGCPASKSLCCSCRSPYVSGAAARFCGRCCGSCAEA